MRFDDRIRTVLAWAVRDDGARARLWRQLVDLLAAGDAGVDPALIEAAFDRLAALGPAVTDADRRAATAQIVGQPSARLAALLGLAPPARAEAAPSVSSERVRSEPIGEAPGQIVDLLARIDAYHERQRQTADAGFSFTVDRDGRLRDARHAPLPASLAEPPLGVDGHAAGAWREGVRFDDARLSIEHGPYAGEWRISAAPDHDAAGRPTLFRGDARRPRPEETATRTPVAPGPDEAMSGIDTAIDRLRAPLEAIARLADAALPAGDLRAAATEVAERGIALKEALDALEIAVAVAGDDGLDAAALLVRIDAALQPLARARGLRMSFRLARGLPPVNADPQAVERMIARLVGAIVSLGRRGELVVARLGRDRRNGQMLALSITRPGRLLGRPPQSLLDPPEASGADAPELGLGFALRLVDRLAQEAAGRLTIHDDRIVLSLPLHADRPPALRARSR